MKPTAKNIEAALAKIEMDADLRKIIAHVLAKKFAPKPPDKQTVKHAVEIYNAYPRKIGRPAAIAKILKALVKNNPFGIFEATTQFAHCWEGASREELHYCPHPSTWFGQERFLDDPSTWERHGKNKNSGRPPVNPNANTLNDGWATGFKKSGGVAPLPDL